MQNYNTYNSFNGYPNRWNGGYTGNAYGSAYPVAPQNYQPAPVQQPADERIFVTGRAGADAHQLPPGVNMQILWDNDQDRFYIKGYDNNGRPRVLADNDFQPHVEPETKPSADLSMYATKDDIKSMIQEAVSNIRLPNMNSYVTKNELETELSGLCVGNGGRVVKSYEPNA